MTAAGACLIRSSRNILLRQLSGADRALLQPHLTQHAVECGTTILDVDQQLDCVYFPDSVMVSLEEVVGPGRSVEIAVIGCEGLVGWPALLGSSRSAHLAVVRMQGGTLLRIGMKPLLAACAQSPTLRAALLQFVNLVIVQMARSIASHLYHSLDQRMARWLLMRHDRVGGDLLLVRHEEIAESLNVRRASITDGLHLLEGWQMVRCNRGRLWVRDRMALEDFAGDAYGSAEAHYRSLIAPFGKSQLRTAA